MRRWTLGWALATCAIAAVGCGGSSKTPPAPSAAKGVSGQYYYLAVAPAVGGTIVSREGSITCQPDGTGCGDATFHQTKFTWATPVILTATAISGFQFDSWTGDCGGTTNVCTLGTGAKTEYAVVAVFKAVAAAKPVPAASLGRVYGYVKDGGVGVAGVSVKLGSATTTTNGNGAYVFEVAPGSYSLTTVASSSAYVAAAPITVTVPLTDGVADPAGVCFLGGAKQGFWVPTAGQAGAGCLVKQNDIALTRASGYVAPVAAPVIVTTPVMPAVVGFGTSVTVSCGAGGVVAQAKDTTGALVGPTPALTSDGSGNSTFTTALLSDAAVTSVLATTTDGRPGIVSINQSQAGALTYTLQCTLNGASATVKVPMVAAVNANVATALRGEPFKMASYKAAAGGLPGITGPLWAAGAETKNGGVGANFDGSPWRAHDAVQVPSGVILILDGPAGANWKFCSAATDSYGTCGSNANATTANAALAAHGNAWVKVTWTSKTLYLTSDALSAGTNSFVGEPNIPVKPRIWGGWDQRGKVDGTGAAIESCAGCHVAPGEAVPWDVTVCPLTPKDGITPCYELGPTEPTTGWLESKHSKAGIDGGSSLHGFTLQACGACHTTGFDNILPATNVGFSALLGTYTNDFLFEGSDTTVWQADLAAKNPAAAAVNNVQCGSCHGPTPNSPNHTASMSSKVCGTCHNGYDPQYEQWATSGHNRLAAAIAEGPAYGRDQTDCGRCHFAQGFMLYVPQLLSGNPDKLGNTGPAGTKTAPILCADGKPGTAPASTDTCLIAQTTGLVTAQNIDQITCQTCHDPHSLEVRVKQHAIGTDDKASTAPLLLAAGFSIQNAGSGALCASCHNSLNGIVNATAPNLNTGVVSVAGTAVQRNDATPLTGTIGLGAPHEAAQADVYFAGNGYLLCNNGNASGACAMPTKPNFHADARWFKDTCVECHVKRLNSATKGTPSNHTFAVDDTTCAGCHGTNSWIQDRKNAVAAKLTAYKTSLVTVLNNASITSVKCNGAAVDVTGQPITNVALVSVSRNLGFDLTFSGAAGAQTQCTVDDVMVGSTSVLQAGGVYGKIVKSMYNYFLITNDKSGGIHNIPFVDAMLSVMSDATKLDSSGLPK